MLFFILFHLSGEPKLVRLRQDFCFEGDCVYRKKSRKATTAGFQKKTLVIKTVVLNIQPAQLKK